MVWASDNPWPSWELNTFVSETIGSPEPSAIVAEIRQTPPSVSVPSTSIRNSLILRARASTSGEARGAVDISDMTQWYIGATCRSLIARQIRMDPEVRPAIGDLEVRDLHERLYKEAVCR